MSLLPQQLPPQQGQSVSQSVRVTVSMDVLPSSFSPPPPIPLPLCIPLLLQMQSLTSCQCSVCHDCFRIHFTIAVRDKHIRDMVCPVCSEPDINDPEQLDSYFSTLDIQVGRKRPETSSSSSSQRFTSEGFKLDLERPCGLLM